LNDHSDVVRGIEIRNARKTLSYCEHEIVK
jgi:hypothetical protein